MKNARFYIDNLQLLPHPEGGYYREVYGSGEIIAPENLPGRYDGPRCFSTSIYFLLDGTQKSAFHRLRSDEIWHFHDGSPAHIYCIGTDGVLTKQILGLNAANEESPQVLIPHGTWFAAEVSDASSFVFLSCTVAPGFDFADFELAKEAELASVFPAHKTLIAKF